MGTILIVLVAGGLVLVAGVWVLNFALELFSGVSKAGTKIFSGIRHSYSQKILPEMGKVLDVPDELKWLLENSKSRSSRVDEKSHNSLYDPKLPDFPLVQKTVFVPFDRIIFTSRPAPTDDFFDIKVGDDAAKGIDVREIKSLHTPFSLDDRVLGKGKITFHKQSFENVPPPPAYPNLNELLPSENKIPLPILNLPHVEYEGLKGKFLNSHLESVCKNTYAKEILEFKKWSDDRDGLIELHNKLNKKYKQDNEKAIKKYEVVKAKYDQSVQEYTQSVEDINQRCQAECDRQNLAIKLLRDGFASFGKDGVEGYVDFLLKRIPLPRSIPREWKLCYSPENKILIVDYRFPYIPDLKIVKLVGLKTRNEWKLVNKSERKELAQEIHPSLSVRIAYEIARHDDLNAIDAIVINGWLRYSDQSTGNVKETYCSSILCQKEELLNLNLNSIDPVKCFQSFKGRSAGESFDVVPITPILSLDTQDKRWVDAKEVLSHLNEGDNIATMDWESFEHLVRQLFEKLYAEHGAEVKITQASRDLGVDAVIFDPTPIKGGKTVIQAKRYVNLVDVSAVRDLFGTVHNEGANKGILVTTSYFGPESYEFAKDKPLELINGQQLLGLLEQFGYNKLRINLEEARVINKEAMARSQLTK